LLNIRPEERAVAIQRLTALWALNECGLGGILHAFNSPFTGLVVGGIAMVCITLICSLAENKWNAVMTALVIVLIIKGMVSPHSSPTAYIAVVFQAITGAFIYRILPQMLLGILLFFVLGYIESALQRLLMLTILYGQSFWEAIDIWGRVIAERWQVFMPWSSSRLIIYAYLALHLIAGVVMGYWTWRLVRQIRTKWGDAAYRLQLSGDDAISFSSKPRRKKNRWKKYLLLVIVVLMMGIAYFVGGDLQTAWQKGLVTLLRVIGIMVVWYVFLSPLVVRWIQGLLKKRYQHLANAVTHTMDMFPRLLWLLKLARQASKENGVMQRWKSFLLLSFLYILQYQLTDDPDPDRTGEKL
jgi:hypothetical protein